MCEGYLRHRGVVDEHSAGCKSYRLKRVAQRANSIMMIFALILTSAWLAWTVLVDFFIAPTVFANVPDFFMAGRLAVAVFTKLNLLEFPLTSLLFVLTVLHVRRHKTHKLLILLSFALLGIAGLYLFSLTPKLTALTEAWEYAERMGTLGSGGEDVQQLHQSYHRTYVTLDTIKLLLLLVKLTFLGVFLSRRTR